VPENKRLSEEQAAALLYERELAGRGDAAGPVRAPESRPGAPGWAGIPAEAAR